MYRDLFFDLDHTLWDFERNSRLTLQEAFETFGLHEILNLSFESFLGVYEEINHELWNLYRAGSISRDLLRNQRFAMVLSRYGVSDATLGNALSDYYIHHSPRKVALMPGAKLVLDGLRNRYRLHIITNGFNEVQFTKLKFSGLSDYFSEVITSEAAGVNKPHLDIFRHALQQTGASADTSLMIGDHWEADILGAAGIGMDQAWYNPGRAPVPSPPPTYSIHSLEELLELL